MLCLDTNVVLGCPALVQQAWDQIEVAGGARVQLLVPLVSGLQPPFRAPRMAGSTWVYNGLCVS